ncbi:hypothetical protein [Scytonema sp. PCC 10023]|uniref:hypothetical protein n=1 Tax=Scytonema sp. PCC 10023 TaxID=1680591 RepID=UPI0039C64AE7
MAVPPPRSRGHLPLSLDFSSGVAEDRRIKQCESPTSDNLLLGLAATIATLSEPTAWMASSSMADKKPTLPGC